MRADDAHHGSLGLRNGEVAFYDAEARHNPAVLEFGNGALKATAWGFVADVRASATIDLKLKDSARAMVRAKVRRLLAKYQPGAEAKAVDLMLEQAELSASLEGS